MNVHKNAKLTPLGREQIVKRKAAGETSGAIATALGVSTATVSMGAATRPKEPPGCKIEPADRAG